MDNKIEEVKWGFAGAQTLIAWAQDPVNRSDIEARDTKIAARNILASTPLSKMLFPTRMTEKTGCLSMAVPHLRAQN